MTDTAQPHERRFRSPGRSDGSVIPADLLAHGLLAASRDTLLAFDPAGQVIAASDSVFALSGFRPEELVGGELSGLLGRGARWRRWIERRSAGRPTRWIALRHREGRVLRCELALTRAGSADQVIHLVCLRELGQARRAEQAERSLWRALASVGRESGELAHDIKNSSTAVHLALRAVARALGEEERSVVEELGERLRRLQERLLAVLQRARPLPLALQSVSAAELLCRVQELRPDGGQAGAARLELEEAPAELVLCCDRELLSRACASLAAASFAAAGATGRVRLGIDRVGREAVLRIDDDAPGLPSERMECLLPAGGWLGSDSADPVLACKVVREHGGSVEARRSPLGGTRLLLRIPLKPQP